VGWTVLAVLLLQVVGAGAVAVRSLAHGLRWEDAAARVLADPAALALVQAGAFGMVIALATRLHAPEGEPVRETLGLRPVNTAAAWVALAAGMALQLPLAELSNLVQEVWPLPESMRARQAHLLAAPTPWAAIAATASLVVVAPATEEMLFRGVLLRGIERRRGRGVALLASSLLFGLSHHAGPAAVAYATAAGLVLGAVALRTGSTFASMAVHGAINAVPLLVPRSLLPIPGLHPEAGDDAHVPAALVVASAAVAACMLALLARLSRPSRGPEPATGDRSSGSRGGSGDQTQSPGGDEP
jgi:membrane protease YdiL (CAAX protease family)